MFYQTCTSENSWKAQKNRIFMEAGLNFSEIFIMGPDTEARKLNPNPNPNQLDAHIKTTKKIERKVRPPFKKGDEKHNAYTSRMKYNY